MFPRLPPQTDFDLAEVATIRRADARPEYCMKSKNPKKGKSRSSHQSAKNKPVPKSNASRSALKADVACAVPMALKRLLAMLKVKKQALSVCWKRSVILTYEIGSAVAKVMRDDATYGSGAVETLAKELEVDKATLYKWAKVANTWTKAAFIKLAERLSVKSGIPLTWSHFEELSEEKDTKRRELLVERTLDEALPIADLRALIKGVPKKSSGRTPPAASAMGRPDIWNQAYDLVNLQSKVVAALSGVRTVPLTAEHSEQMKELYASCEKLLAAIKPIVATAPATPVEVPPLKVAQ